MKKKLLLGMVFVFTISGCPKNKNPTITDASKEEVQGIKCASCEVNSDGSALCTNCVIE